MTPKTHVYAKTTCTWCPVCVPPCGLLVLLLVELLLLLDSWVGLLFDVLLLVEGSALVCAPGAVPFCLIWGLIGGTVLFPVLELPPTMPTEPGGGWTFKRMERGVKKKEFWSHFLSVLGGQMAEPLLAILIHRFHNMVLTQLTKEQFS